MGDRVESEILADLNGSETAGYDIQSLTKELEYYKSMYQELSENNSTMSEQLSLLQEENESLKSKINLTEQRYESQINQIMRLNEEISKSMQEKEQLESDVNFFKNLYDSMSTSSLPPAVAEEMRKKVESVGSFVCVK